MSFWLKRLVLASSSELFFLSGVCLGVGFLWTFFWWLVVPGISLFLYASNKVTSSRKAFLGGWLAFSVKMFFSIGWFWTTYPIEWIDLSLGVFELPVIGFYWFTVSLAIGLSGGILAWTILMLRDRLSRIMLAVSLILLWVPTEILGALFFSIFTYGEGGLINTLFSFGYAGYLLAAHPLFIASSLVGGVYGLSFLAATLGSLLYFGRNYLWSLKYQKIITLVFLLFIFTSGLVWTKSNPNPVGVKVAVVDTVFGGTEYFSLVDRESVRTEQIKLAYEAALKTGADYIIMPEDSRFFGRSLGATEAYQLYKFSRPPLSHDTVLVDAGLVPISLREVTLRSTIYDDFTGTGYATDKQYLVPQGEFMPNFYLYFLSLVGLDRVADDIRQKLSYRPGPLSDQSTFPTHLPGILFCFASADPVAVRQLTQEREMPFVAHPISHAWFNKPTSLRYQFDLMLKVQAVWNKIPIVSAGNMVQGALYTPRGEKVIPEVVAKGERWTVGVVSF